MNDRRRKWKLAEWKFYDSLCIWRDERRKIFCRPKKDEEEKKKWKLCMRHMYTTEAKQGEILYLLEQ